MKQKTKQEKWYHTRSIGSNHSSIINFSRHNDNVYNGRK